MKKTTTESRATITKWRADYFKDNMDSISICLRHINRMCAFDGETTARSAQKIIDQLNVLPADAAFQTTSGLSQILCFLAARMSDVTALTQALSDPTCVPPKVLRSIVSRPAMQNCSGNLLETLIGELPEEMRPQ